MVLSSDGTSACTWHDGARATALCALAQACTAHPPRRGALPVFDLSAGHPSTASGLLHQVACATPDRWKHRPPRPLTTAHSHAGDASGDGSEAGGGGVHPRQSHRKGTAREGQESATTSADGVLPVVVPIVFDEPEFSRQRQAADAAPAPDGGIPGLGPGPVKWGADGGRDPGTRLGARWPAVLLLPTAVWGLAWASTVGLVSAGYAALASAAAIAASTFSSLAPGADAVATSAAAVAAVDWVDVALRTTAGLTADDGGAGRAQVLTALQEAGAGRAASWAVLALLPGLCALASGCGSAATAVGTALPLLEPVARLAAAAAGLGVLLLLAMPLRPYLAPLLPVLPRGRPSPATSAALWAGGATCMVAVLTALQAQELAPPPLVPSVRGAAAAAALASPLLLQKQAALYGAAAAVSDFVLPACTAVVAARAVHKLLRRGYACVGQPGAAQSAAAEADSGKAAAAAGRGPAATFRAVRALAAGRLALEVLLLMAVGAGALPGKISAVRLLGMIWLLQASTQA